MLAFSLQTPGLAGTWPQRKRPRAFISTRQAAQTSGPAPPRLVLQPASEPLCSSRYPPVLPLLRSQRGNHTVASLLHLPLLTLNSFFTNSSLWSCWLRPDSLRALAPQDPEAALWAQTPQFCDPRMDALKQESKAVAVRKTREVETPA